MSKKKSTALMLLMMALLVGGVMGTVAWLTDMDTVTNTFTVAGDITEPTDPEDLPDVEDPANPFNPDTDGYIWEPSWNEEEDHKIVPGAIIPKDPYVGIGAGSEDSTVYVYVHNNFPRHVYFFLGEGWEPVSGNYKTGTAEGSYANGLFKYTAGLTGNADSDTWTATPVFSDVVVDDAATSEHINIENKEIKVGAYIHQAKDGDGNAVNMVYGEIVNALKEKMGVN